MPMPHIDPFLMLLARVEQLCTLLDSDLLNMAMHADEEDVGSGVSSIRHASDRVRAAAIDARLAMIGPTYEKGNEREAMYLADLTLRVSDYKPK